MNAENASSPALVLGIDTGGTYTYTHAGDAHADTGGTYTYTYTYTHAGGGVPASGTHQ